MSQDERPQRPCMRIPRALQALCLVLATAVGSHAQQRPYHYFQRADMPPGSIGQAQLMRGGPLPGHFQAVQITAPAGTHVALANAGLFEPPQPAPLTAGLLVGHVYRLKVTNIPQREGEELYPSIEVINRLYPPADKQADFPIPVELTREELERALRGQFVVRVIYLEDPRTALPRREDPTEQRYFEVAPHQDPLEVADVMGRPMAILRIGSRIPAMDPMSGAFDFQSPPWIRFPQVVMEEPSPIPATNEAAAPTATQLGSPRPLPATAQRIPTGVGVPR
jgi:hypothetical protein